MIVRKNMKHKKAIKTDFMKRANMATIQWIHFVHGIVDSGIEVDSLDLNGWSMMHASARHCHRSVMEWLIGNGASADVASSDGTTPLMTAIQCRQ